MIRDPQIMLFDLAICLSDAMDFVSPALVDHHKQVAYIATRLGMELGLDGERQKDLFLAGAFHDMGALSLQERIGALQFELENAEHHAELGCSLVRTFAPLEKLAPIIRFHHCSWNDGAGESVDNEEVFLESHIVHLADRTAVLIDRDREILGQVKTICETVRGQSRRMFKPEIVDAFLSLAQKEHFWLDAVSTKIYRILRKEARLRTILLTLSQLNDLAVFFSRIIDFRSAFTATHSRGVAASAVALAGVVGFSERECELMRIAGHLHDLGKLAVSKEILEKAAKLTKKEFEVIRSHTYYTYHILDTLDDFDTINTWAAFHHERLNGKGYPFHHKGGDLSLGSRIMCVADVFTAVAEDRPYRKSMSREEIMKVLKKMASASSLDPELVSCVERHFDEMDQVRKAAQMEQHEEYRKILRPS